MKTLFAWLPKYGRPQGKIEFCGLCIGTTVPAGLEPNHYIKFGLCKGESIEMVKGYLQGKRKQLQDDCIREREASRIRIIGSDRAMMRAKYDPERQTGCSYASLL